MGANSNKVKMPDDPITQDQQSLVLGWSIGIAIFTVIFLSVIFLMWRD